MVGYGLLALDIFPLLWGKEKAAKRLLKKKKAAKRRERGGPLWLEV